MQDNKKSKNQLLLELESRIDDMETNQILIWLMYMDWKSLTEYFQQLLQTVMLLQVLYPWSPFSFEFERGDTNKFMTLEMQA